MNQKETQSSRIERLLQLLALSCFAFSGTPNLAYADTGYITEDAPGPSFPACRSGRPIPTWVQACGFLGKQLGYIIKSPGHCELPEGAPQQLNYCLIGQVTLCDGFNFVTGACLEDPGKPIQAGPPPEGACGGNPINLSNGNKYQVELDIPDVGTGLSFSRTYNSVESANATSIGFGWRHNWDYRVTYKTIANQWGNTYEAWVARPDGRSFVFGVPAESNKYQSVTAGMPGELTELKNGAGARIGWTYVSADGSTESYNDVGKLTSIVKSDGEKYTLAYSANEIVVTHEITTNTAVNPKLRIQIGPSGSVEIVVSPDGRFWYYNYTSGRLVDVADPDGKHRVYSYENASYPNHLTGITDERGVRYVTWEYDSAGRAWKSYHALNTDMTTVDYSQLASANIVRITNALGKSAKLHLESNFGRKRVTQVEGEPSANCVAANKLYQYDDVNGSITMVDWNGHSTQIVRDDQGREVWRKEAAADAPNTRVVKTEWDGFSNRPRKIIEPNRITEMTYENGKIKTRRECRTTAPNSNVCPAQ